MLKQNIPIDYLFSFTTNSLEKVFFENFSISINSFN
jgi:hypothetical protein